MQNIIFIYSTNLTSENLTQFEQKTGLKNIKQAEYLGYKIAFFESDLPLH